MYFQRPVFRTTNYNFSSFFFQRDSDEIRDNDKKVVNRNYLGSIT